MDIRECDIRIEFYRASGPGGQHRNTTDSAVRIRHLPTGVVVTASEARSQSRNREVAMARLQAVLEARSRRRKKRVATSIPPRERKKRLEEKRRESLRKSERRVRDGE